MKKLNIVAAGKQYVLKGVDDKFNQAFSKWMEGAETIVKEGYKDAPNINPKLSYMDGKKYVRIVKEYSQESAFAFIDKTNGDILKTAGWSAPAKGARGNLFDESNGLRRVTPYGIEYNR